MKHKTAFRLLFVMQMFCVCIIMTLLVPEGSCTRLSVRYSYQRGPVFGFPYVTRTKGVLYSIVRTLLVPEGSLYSVSVHFSYQRGPALDCPHITRTRGVLVLGCPYVTRTRGVLYSVIRTLLVPKGSCIRLSVRYSYQRGPCTRLSVRYSYQRGPVFGYPYVTRTKGVLYSIVRTLLVPEGSLYSVVRTLLLPEGSCIRFSVRYSYQRSPVFDCPYITRTRGVLVLGCP